MSIKKGDASTSTEKQDHNCPRKRCCCNSVNELTCMLEELREIREKAESSYVDKPEYQMPKSEAEVLEDDATLCAATLTRVQQQRDDMTKLMSELRELSEIIAIREESVCETEKKITDFQDEVYGLINALNEQNSPSNVENKDEEGEKSDAAWNKAVALETMEQDRLQKHMKRVSYSLTTQKMEEKLFVEKRSDQRKTDSKLLLCAIDYIDKCLEDSRKLISKRAE